MKSASEILQKHRQPLNDMGEDMVYYSHAIQAMNEFADQFKNPSPVPVKEEGSIARLKDVLENWTEYLLNNGWNVSEWRKILEMYLNKSASSINEEEKLPISKVHIMVKQTLTTTLEGFYKWLKEDTVIVDKDTKLKVPNTEIALIDNAKAPTDYIYPELANHGITFTIPTTTPTEEQKNKYPIGGFAPGAYTCTCIQCKKQFQGDKRAFQCEPCAIKNLEAYNATFLKPEEQDKEVKEEKKMTIEKLRTDYWFETNCAISNPDHYAQWLENKLTKSTPPLPVGELNKMAEERNKNI